MNDRGITLYSGCHYRQISGLADGGRNALMVKCSSVTCAISVYDLLNYDHVIIPFITTT